MDFIKALKVFHSNGMIPKGENASFIALIPKRDNSQGLGEFRVISEGVFKVIAKLLATHIEEC